MACSKRIELVKKVSRVRHAPDVRSALIIAAAQQVIAEQGYPAASARVIAAQCGISPGTLTYHFPTVDELLVAALRNASAQFTETIVTSARQESTAATRLMHLVEAALPTSAQASRNWKLWLEYWARAAHNPALAALHGERYAMWRGAIAEAIDEGIASGEFLPTDSTQAAFRIAALLDGLGLQAVISGTAANLAVARGILQDTIKALSPAMPATPRKVRR